MNKEELAKKLNGTEYKSTAIHDVDDEAHNNGLIIAVGYSDDLLVLSGAVHSETNAWDGTCAKLGYDGIPENMCQDDDCPYFHAEVTRCKHWVKAEWCPKDLDCSWLITASVPFASFDIMDVGELFCRGIVFERDALKEEAK